MKFSSFWRVTFGEMDNFWHLFDFQGAQKKVKNWNLSLTCDCIKSLMRNYVSLQICSFWGSLLIQFLINSSNFHSFWPQGCPQKVSKKVICLETSNLWWEILSPCKFAALVVIFRIGNFDPFCPQRSSGCPQNGQKNYVWQK